MTDSRRVALVTGASAGIGAALARALGGSGFDLALGARRLEPLEAVAEEVRGMGARVFAHSLDVTDSASIAQFFSECERALGVAEVVINNAGASKPAPLEEYSEAWIRKEIETNFLGPIFVTQHALQRLREHGRRGDLVFISSDATHRPRPQQVLYGAAKAGLENFATGLAMELEGSGIRVAKIRVGPTRTEFGKDWDMGAIGEQMKYWGKFGLRDARWLGALLSADDVARAVVDVLRRPAGVWIDTIEIQPAAPTGKD